MTIKEFVNGYNEASDKEKYCKKHVVNTYIPYAIKISDCERIANSSCYVNGEFKPDGIVQYILYTRLLLERYTDLNFSESTLEEFDELESAGAMSLLIGLLPASEKSMYKTILEIKVDDICSYESDIVTFLKNRLSALNEVLSSVQQDSHVDQDSGNNTDDSNT